MKYFSCFTSVSNGTLLKEFGECVFFQSTICIQRKKDIRTWTLKTGDNSYLDSVLTRCFFVVLTLKASVYFDEDFKGFRQGTDREWNLPGLPAAMLLFSSLTGSNGRIWHNRQLCPEQRYKKAFHCLSSPNPSYSLTSFLPSITGLPLNENICHSVI